MLKIVKVFKSSKIIKLKTFLKWFVYIIGLLYGRIFVFGKLGQIFKSVLNGLKSVKKVFKSV